MTSIVAMLFHAIAFVTESRLFQRCIALKFACDLVPLKGRREREQAAFSSSVLRKERCGSHTPTHSLPVIPPTSTDSSLFLSDFCFFFLHHVFPTPRLFYSFSSLFQIVRVHNDTCPSFPFGFYLLTYILYFVVCVCM